MTQRQRTADYPDNARNEWATRMLVQPHVASNGLYEFAYAVYANQRSRELGDRPFLFNSHKAMIRETHQRIKLTPTGEYTHVSGVTLKPEDVEEFLATDSRANPKGPDPFMFPTYYGVMEALDPQWLRETYILPQAGQVDALVGRYLKGVETRRLSGDHRGTTLDLQVGAGVDDAFDTGSTLNSTNSFLRCDLAGYTNAFRIDNVTVPNADTIDEFYIVTYAISTSWDDPDNNYDLEAADDAVDFDGANPHPRNRTLTGNSVLINATGVGAGAYNSPSNIAACQAVVDRVGWVSGQAMVAVIDPEVTDAVWILHSWDGDSAEAPGIHIEHSPGAPPVGPPPGMLMMRGVGR